MLPVLRVQSLLRVADDRYLSETLRHREKMRDSQTERDLAGFYVYQSYLKRLRRLHKNYVKKFRTLQQQQQGQQSGQKQQPGQQQQQQQRRRQDDPQPGKHPLFLPNCHLKTEHSYPMASHTASNGKRDWPHTKFRLEVNQSLDLSLRFGKNCWDHSEMASHLPPVGKQRLPPITNSFVKKREEIEEEGEEEEDWEEGEESGGKGDPIYIPCGRENSELRLQKLQKRKERQKARHGAMSFRMWRSVQGNSGSAYST